MRQVDQKTLNEAVASHGQWLKGKSSGERADFTKCSLNGLRLSECDLQSALFSDVRIEGCEFLDCDFSYADFSEGHFNTSCFAVCDLTATNFSRSKWTKCRLSTVRELPDDSLLVSETELTSFKGAEFVDVNLDGYFTRVRFDNVTFDNVVAKNAHFLSCQVCHAEIRDCQFEGSTFSECWFGDCVMSDCDFTRAELRECNFGQSTLERLAFSDADATGNIMYAAKLSGLHFAGGRFTNFTNHQLMHELDHADVDDARYAGACFYFTGGPLPSRSEIEWSDDCGQNIWVLRC